MKADMKTVEQNKIEIIDGEECYVLPEHSYVSWLYEESRGEISYNHSYIRLPVEGSTTVYEDRKITHVHLRDDVHISTYPDGSVVVSWKRGYGDPFINIYQYRTEQRRKEIEKERFFELLQEKGRSIDSTKVSVQFKDGKIEIKHLDSGHTEIFFGAYSAYNHIMRNELYCTTQP